MVDPITDLGDTSHTVNKREAHMHNLREHQSQSIAAMDSADRGIINLPTGTGKTLIQSRHIVNDIKANVGKTKVYVVLASRIVLSDQLSKDVKRDLVQNGNDCQYMTVHSGRGDDSYTKEEREFNIKYRTQKTSTKQRAIRTEYERAVSAGVPFVISGTYHSAERIANAIGDHIDITYCDEAHYLVQEDFSWIPTDFPSKRVYYFTATLRETPSGAGMGMNNVERFGEVLYQQIPVNMIEAGEMVRVRMHLVDLSDTPDRDEADGFAVAEAFKEHSGQVNMGAKLLVVAKDGSDHLNALVGHSHIQELQEVRPQLKVYDISSVHGARINGVGVSRKAFFDDLRSLTDADEAIIIHCDILAEGIDVPGITGVMPLRSLGKAKFLQTLGRASRLHVNDRARLYGKTLESSSLSRFVKPYAWLVLPVYGEFGNDTQTNMREMIRELRDHGFNPAEDIMIRQRRGRTQLDPIDEVQTTSETVRTMVEFTSTALHDIEAEEEANRFTQAVIVEEANATLLTF